MTLLLIPVHKISVTSEFQRIAKKDFDWCRNNHMKANPEKCHLILSSNTQGRNSL